MKSTAHRHFRGIPPVALRKSLHPCNVRGSIWRVTYATDWADYLQAITGTDTGRQIAQKTGNSESTISRWKSGAYLPEPRQAVIVARAYARNPIEALIGTGYLTENEAALPATRPRALELRDFTDLELAQEMVRRVESGEPGHELLDQPLDENHPALRNDEAE